MIFSLHRRFLLLLLLPVALILIAAGAGGFFYSRTLLFDQWVDSTRLKLEKATLGIGDQLTDKLQLIDLIGKAQEIPGGDLTQAFLIQQLAERKGVKFVDVDVEVDSNRNLKEIGKTANDYGPGVVEGLYTMEVCDDVGFCSPTMEPGAADRSLRIVKALGGTAGEPVKKLTVRIGFDSFLHPIREMGLSAGNTAVLVTSTGQFLASTDKSQFTRKLLGDNGDNLEKKTLKEIMTKPFGTILGEGHPPEVVVGFHKVPMINWYLVLFSKGSEAMESLVRFRFYYLIAATTCIVAILLLIRFTTRSVGQAIGQISGAATRVREGDYSVRLPENRSDEIGQLTKSFNEMIMGLEQRDLIQQTFGRYVDKSVAEELMSRPEALRMGGEKKTVTIMMTDLRNFTAISEDLSPEVVIRMLNRYFARMIAVIERYKGIIVDFYGDSILVFFDGLTADIVDRAADAIKCAMEMQNEEEGFVREMLAEGLPEIRMGIGIHTGDVIVGNIGTESRAKYGIVGSDVNLTARIQATAGAGKIVISEETYRTLADRIRIAGEFRVCLKGVKGDRELYEVECVDCRDDDWCRLSTG